MKSEVRLALNNGTEVEAEADVRGPIKPSNDDDEIVQTDCSTRFTFSPKLKGYRVARVQAVARIFFGGKWFRKRSAQILCPDDADKGEVTIWATEETAR